MRQVGSRHALNAGVIWGIMHTFNFVPRANIRKQREQIRWKSLGIRENLGNAMEQTHGTVKKLKTLCGSGGLGSCARSWCIRHSTVWGCMVAAGLWVSPLDCFENWGSRKLGSLTIGLGREKRLESGRRAENEGLNYFLQTLITVCTHGRNDKSIKSGVVNCNRWDQSWGLDNEQNFCDE